MSSVPLPHANGFATKFYDRYRRANDVLERIVVALACLIVAMIVLFPLVSVLVRISTGEGYSFLAESAPQLVPWVVFPMIGVLLRRDAHINVDVATHLLRGRALTGLRVLVLAISLLGTALMGVFGARTTLFFARLGQLSTTEIEFPLWYLYVSYPIGMLLAANFCLESLIGEALGRRPRVAAELL